MDAEHVAVRQERVGSGEYAARAEEPAIGELLQDW